MKRLILILSVFFLLFPGCRTRTTDRVGPDYEAMPVAYARCFEVNRFDGYTQVLIRDPWDTARYLSKYILVPKADDLPEVLPEGTVIRIPLGRVIAFSSVHCGVMNELGIREEIVGVAESRYIDIPFIQEGLENGTIVDVGESFSPDIERIIDLAPDIITTSPIQGMSYGQVEKIGIPLLEATDYMETTPLGRAEWIRLYGLFFGKEELADSIFSRIATDYEATRAMAASVAKRPVVLPEYRTGSAWYVPGGRSYMARLYRDAGADYPWSDNEDSGSLALAFESVLERAADADVWVFKYNRPDDMSYSDLRNDYAGYANFAPFKNKALFAANTGKVPFYEELPIHPEYVLRDLAWVFHPELLPEYEPRYFKPLKD